MDRINNALETVFSNKYASVIVSMFLVFYSGLAAPRLPNFIKKLFENPIFRILILSLIVYKGNKDPQLAIMIAIGFTVTMNLVSSQRFFETFADHGDHSESGSNMPEQVENIPEIDTEVTESTEGTESTEDNQPENTVETPVETTENDNSSGTPGTPDTSQFDNVPGPTDDYE